MAVSIQPGSAKITITARPQVNAPVVNGTAMSYTGTSIQANGEVTLLGAPGDSTAGWTVGFVQVQWVETNWCFYRGQAERDGSIFIQRARPPARPSQACCDCVNGSPPSRLFYNTLVGNGGIIAGSAGATFPQKLAVTHYDLPQDSVNLVEMNASPASGGGPKPNFLAESQMEFAFCTILSVRPPSGVFEHLLSFYWNMNWQARFHPTSFANPPAGFRITPLAAGSSAHVGHIIQGTPTDRRFVSILNSVPTQSCNQVATAEINGPNRHEAPVWRDFDVRRP